MKDAVKLLPHYPNMKIIHLVRDPRGIMNSRLNIHMASEPNLKSLVSTHCTTVEEDLEFSETIMSIYSHRLKILHYEDLAVNTIKTARALFQFSGLKLFSPVIKFINKQTHSRHGDLSSYSTERANSSKTASKWRSQIKLNVSNFIYDMCLKSNQILGYLPLTTNEGLRDLNFPSRKKIDHTF
jgi:hypothetical protein